MKKLILSILIIGLLAGCSLREDSEPQVREVTPEPTIEQLRSDLFEAVLNEDFRSVENLIKNGADLEGYDQQGHTVLMRAVQLRSSIMVNILVDGGAKIFAPMKNNPLETAITKVHASDDEIKNIINKEKVRIASKVKSIILDGDYVELLSYVQSNFIPYTLSIEGSSDLASYSIESIQGVENGEFEFIKYMAEGRGHEKLNVFDFKDQLVQLSTRLSNIAIFEYTVSKIRSHSNLDTHLIIEADSANADWFSEKLFVLRRQSVSLSIDFLLSMLPGVENSNSNSFVKLNKEVLYFYQTSYDKNQFLKSVIENLINHSAGNQQYISWISPTIDMWMGLNIELSGYSIDELMVSFLSTTEKYGFDLSRITSINRSFQSFTKNRDTVKTFEYIFGSSYSLAQKSKLLDLVLTYTDRLPEGVLALASSADSVLLLNKLLDSNKPFDPSEQSGAVLAALENTSSGDVAKSLLLTLKEKGIPFNTREAANALLFAYQKMWKDNDMTYSKVIDFLISISPSPINALTNDEKVDLLSNHLDFVIRGDKNLSDLEQIIQRLNPAISGYSLYTQTYYLGNVQHNATTTFVWDYISTMYKHIQNSPDDMSSAMAVLNKIVKKFPGDEMSLLFYNNSIVQEKEIVTRKILPLSLMLSFDNTLFYNSIENSEGYHQAFSFPTQVSLFSLYSGAFYSEFGENKEYWTNVVSVLLDNGYKVNTINHPSYSRFIKSVFATDSFSKFPKLREALGAEKITLHKTHRECVFIQKELADLHSEGDLGTVSGWTTYGSFIALTSLKNKTCQGKKVSMSEISYAKEYINNNLEVPKFDSADFNSGVTHNTEWGPITIDNTSKMVKCAAHREENLGPYSSEKSPLGVAFIRPPQEGNGETTSDSIFDIISISEISIMGQKCTYYPYSQGRHNRAKIAFLNQWLKCAVDNNHTELVNMFESLNSDFHITASDEDFGIKICKF